MNDTAWLVRSGQRLYDEEWPVGIALTEDAARSVAERIHNEGNACRTFQPHVDPRDGGEIECLGTVPDRISADGTMQCSILLVPLPVLAG